MVNSATRNRAHIVSGIVLAAFIASHFINHALGLVSVDTMESTRRALNVVWRSWPGTILLYGALLLHFLAALDALRRRHTLRMPVSEAIKILFGLSLPFLLVYHVVGTRVEFTISGYDRGYPEILRAIWSSTSSIVNQTVALNVAWAHGCLGMWFWLRNRRWFQRGAPFFHMVAIIIPVLSLLGFYFGARSAGMMPEMSGALRAAQAGSAQLADIRQALYWGFGTLISGTLLLKFVPQKGRIRIRYPGGKIVTVAPGFSILEASRSAGIPHVSICGGRGRCSTCRVQILYGMEDQPSPEDREKATLASIGSPRDVRLACQFRPRHDVTVLPLVDADPLAHPTRFAADSASGRERMVVALFCDLRGFTQLSEQKLPYDVVFLLNRYFAMVGEAVESSGGIVDKFIGDGAIALFGLENSFEEACQQALAASVRLAAGIQALNQSFRAELDTPLRIAIGVHGGPVIVGRMGYGKATALTAIGDTINTASRLEGLAKEQDMELAVSADVVSRSGYSFHSQERRELVIRGRAAMLETWMIPRAAEIERHLVIPDDGMKKPS
jgi:adenylate cyclase